MWRRLASVVLFLVIAMLVIACEAITHASDFGTASEQINNCAAGTLPCGGSCVPEDSKNCGECGAVCPDSQVCSDGTCGSSCSANLTQCGGNCVDTQNDPLNCGRCGGVPEAGTCPVCQNGACAASCAAGSILCNGTCVDESKDPKNCGGCGAQFACKGAQVCSGGKCSTSCTDPLKACSGACVDESNDVDHCGSCTRSCGAPDSQHGVAVCVTLVPGVTGCGVACESGFTNCGNDECLCGSSCPLVGTGGNGGTAVACPAGEPCVNGQCLIKH